MVVVEEFLRLFPSMLSDNLSPLPSLLFEDLQLFVKSWGSFLGSPKVCLIVLSCLLPEAPALPLIGYPRPSRCYSRQAHSILLTPAPLPRMQQSFKHEATLCLWHCGGTCPSVSPCFENTLVDFPCRLPPTPTNHRSIGCRWSYKEHWIRRWIQVYDQFIFR